ncbi:hypothetical protein NQ315_008239 [Exocentrus adspersus]|uniref:DDE-1 domain-containing protein n=1 Tax=Exocentrus adspersus TaxID=1586481 RepID=A0AAV8VN05_9CUCU|nr:hypothetical protein NQ315_008239 [Exocentrus adspersus]
METWMPDGPTDQTAFAASKKGWMDSIIFLNWFKKCFLPNIPLERPVLLIFDGHVSHISSELIQTAIENQVTLLKLPSHTTHILQPLDVAVFKSLKTRWDREIVQWQRENPRRKIPKDTFVKVLQKVYLNMPESNILNGFKSTGIYDPDVENHLNVQNDDHDYARPVQEENLTNIEIDNPEESVNSETLNEPYNAMVLITLLQDTTEAESSTNLSTASGEHRENTISTASSENESVQEPKTFEEILISMVKGNKQDDKNNKSRRRLCHGAEVITSEEYFKNKQEQENRQLEKEEKLKAKKLTTTKHSKANEPLKNRKANMPARKPKYTASDTDTDTDNEYLISESERDSDIENIQPSIAVIEGDYVIVY